MFDQLHSKEAMSFIKKFEDVFKGLPHLPKGFINFLVSIAPWLTGLGGIFSILGGLGSFTAQESVNRFAGMMEMYGAFTVNPMYYYIAGILSLVAGVLMLAAFNPLRERKLEGWTFLFWINMISITETVVGIAFGVDGLVGSIIGILIGLYFLFELKPAYDKKKAKK